MIYDHFKPPNSSMRWSTERSASIAPYTVEAAMVDPVRRVAVVLSNACRLARA